MLWLFLLSFFSAAAQSPPQRCTQLDSLKRIISHTPPYKQEYISLCVRISLYSLYCRDADDDVYSASLAYRLTKKPGTPAELRVEAIKVYVKSLTLRGFPDSASALIDSLEILNKTFKNPDIEGLTLLRRGMLSYQKGYYDIAESRLQQAVKIFTKTGNLWELYPCYTGLGLIAGYSGSKKEALQYHQKSFNVARSLGSTFGMAYACFNRAELFINQGSYDSALLYEYQGAALFRKVGVVPPADFSPLDILYILIKKNDKSGALKAAVKFEKLLDSVYTLKIQRSYLISEDYLRLSKIYMELGRPDPSLKMALKALKLLNNKQEPKDLVEFYLHLSALYEAKGELETAMRYRDSSYVLQIRARNNEQALAVQEADAKYKNIEKQQEIEKLLRADAVRKLELEKEYGYRRFFIVISVLLLTIICMVVLLYRRRVSITEQLREQVAAENERNTALHELQETKERFFSLIAHDLRSPVVGFRALPELYERCLRTNDKQMITVLNRIFASQVSNMLAMLDSLLNWSELNQGKLPYKPDTQALYVLVRQTTELLQGNAFLKEVQLINNIEPTVNFYADGKAVGAACRNVLAYCLKHSPAGGSRIVCSNGTVLGFCLLRIDPGTNMLPPSAVAALNRSSEPADPSEPGMMPDRSILGLVLAAEYLNQNGGRLATAESSPPGHITFELWLPLPPEGILGNQ